MHKNVKKKNIYIIGLNWVASQFYFKNKSLFAHHTLYDLLWNPSTLTARNHAEWLWNLATFIIYTLILNQGKNLEKSCTVYSCIKLKYLNS